MVYWIKAKQANRTEFKSPVPIEKLGMGQLLIPAIRRQKQVDFKQEFKANLVYIMSSRTVRMT